MGHICVGLFLVSQFFSIGLSSTPPPVPDCVNNYSCIVDLNNKKSDFSYFTFFFKTVLAILGPFPYTINFRISLFISTRKPTEILVEIVKRICQFRENLTPFLCSI